MKPLAFLKMSISVFLCAFSVVGQTTVFEARIHLDTSAVGYDIRETEDGGYVLTGTAWGGVEDYQQLFIAKLSSDGRLLWSKKFREINYGDALGESILPTEDGGYIASGLITDSSDSNGWIYLVKVDSAGNLIWSNKYSQGWWSIALRMIHDIGGGYILTGYLASSGFLMKIDTNGDSVWLKSIASTYPGAAYCLDQTRNGGYIVVGATYELTATGPVTYPVLARTNSIGETVWQKQYHVLYYPADVYSVAATEDGGFVVGGAIRDSVGTRGALLKTDSLGNTEWLRDYLGGGVIGNSVQQTTDGGYVFTGNNHGYYLIKTDEQGDTLWTRDLHRLEGEYKVVREARDGGYVLVGGARSDIYVLKTDANGNVTDVPATCAELPTMYKLSQNYPNPFNPSTIISYQIPRAGFVSLKIYNLLGQEVATLVDEEKQSGEYKVRWEGTGVPSGVYFYTMMAGIHKETKKLVLVR